MLLRHLQVFFGVAGEILSVPFSQQDTQEISQPADEIYFPARS